MDTFSSMGNNKASSSDFDIYLGSEYAHIAEAHFRTIDTITAFFRYYLLIMSIPISFVVAFLIIAPKPSLSLDTIQAYTPVLATIFLVISLAGGGVLLYLISLRMDAILYARTVNAIRKHFYDKVPRDIMDLDVKLRKRVLPQTSSQPAYFEMRYFGPVVGTIAIFNTLYLFGALTLFGGLTPVDISLRTIPGFVLPVSFIFLISHFLAYFWYAQYREHAYLRSYILGVDICGVLNQHRIQFCEILHKNVERKINPDHITVIPLHEHPTLNVTREDEKRVFNDPEYWVHMSPTDFSPDNLRRIRNAFKLQVILFTHRPWPDTGGMEPEEERCTLDQWRTVASEFFLEARKNRHFFGVRQFINHTRLRIWPGYREISKTEGFGHIWHLVTWARAKLGVAPIEQITRMWLERYEFEYNKLIIEKASEDISDPHVHFVNRFYIARKRGIRFFIDDDLEKVIKLAHICDIVFLFDQPYNQNPEGRELPDNIIRIKSWDAIYREIRRLS